MASSNITDDSAIALNAINTSLIIFTQSWCIAMFIVGLIGHSLNIMVFTRSTLWSNPCIRYLMASSIAGYLISFVILPIRLLQFGYNISLFTHSVLFCKFVTYVLSWIRILPSWFIAFASIDRYLCSSPSTKLRRWSSIRVSKYVISLTIIIVGLTQIPILIYYELNLDPKICLGQPTLFQKLNAILTLIIWSFIPSITMLIFGLFTIRHIRQSTQRIANERRRRTKLVDRQLIRLILIQSILFGLTSASAAIGGTFNTLDDNTRKDRVTLARQNFIGNILSFVGLFSPCISFYVCTLSSQLFRHELAILFHLQQRQDRIYPNEYRLTQRHRNN